MKFSTKNTELSQHKTECLVIGLTSDSQPEQIKELPNYYQKAIHSLTKTKEFTAKVGQTLALYAPEEIIKKVVLLGFGDKKKITAASFRKTIIGLGEQLKKYRHKQVSLACNHIAIQNWDSAEKAQTCAQCLTHSHYTFTRCKSESKEEQKTTETHFTYLCEDTKAANVGLKQGQAIGKGMNVARELGNLPGNICTPNYLAKEAKQLADQHENLKVQVLDEKQMKALKMNSLLSVSAGSKEGAKLIIMEYNGGKKSDKPHVLVGKGITFDTGGISLKPGAGMDEMKFDMCGAASVFGTFHSILTLKPKINVIGIVAAAENMPGSQATKPGDIVTSMSGKTIEILNTDAEGRLVLCDALSYAERYKPQSVIDIATLTGACVIALGKHASGLYSNDEELAQTLLAAGEDSGDRAWHLPLWDEYKKQLESNFADLANIGGREAGSITAACFLSHFTESYSWAHLDIAGTAWLSGGEKGATGRPVPLLVRYLTKIA